MKTYKLFALLITTSLSLSLSMAQSVKKTIKKLPDTGQSASYTSSFGEDNDYNFNTPFYVDNGDGTITDTVTGLMWQKTDGGEMTIDSAHKYVQQLNLATYTDWRLPNMIESFSILKLDALNPSIDITFFPNTNSEYWWTADTAFNNPSKIWVSNSGGGQGPHPKIETISAGGNKRFHTRAVRDITTPTLISNRFIDNGDSTITDQLTDLVWQKFASLDTLSWENALTRAEGATTAGYQDWRLPNIKELASIVNYKVNNPAAFTNIFSSMKAANFWSSTTQFNHVSNAWYVDFKNFGLTTYMDKQTRGGYVICVRNKSQTNTGLSKNELNTVKLFFDQISAHLIIKNTTTCENGIIDIYNVNGQLIEAQQLSTTTQQINCSNYKAGIYYYKIQTPQGQVLSGNFCKEN